jgi:hypothetical protein
MKLIYLYPGLAVAAILLTGCCKTMPVIPDPITCPIPAALLEESCVEPVTIEDGVTYSDLIGASINDRNSLRKCDAHDRLLKNSIRECNAALEQYKSRLQEINQKFGTKP